MTNAREGNHACFRCGTPIPGWRQYCSTRKCRHEYERQAAQAHLTPAYREYMFFYTSELTRVEWREQLPAGTYRNLD